MEEKEREKGEKRVRQKKFKKVTILGDRPVLPTTTTLISK